MASQACNMKSFCLARFAAQQSKSMWPVDFRHQWFELAMKIPRILRCRHWHGSCSIQARSVRRNSVCARRIQIQRDRPARRHGLFGRLPGVQADYSGLRSIGGSAMKTHEPQFHGRVPSHHHAGSYITARSRRRAPGKERIRRSPDDRANTTSSFPVPIEDYSSNANHGESHVETAH